MKILIANDGSDGGMYAVEFAAQFIRSDDVHAKIVTVIEPASTLEVETVIEAVDDLLTPENPAFVEAASIGERSVKLLSEKITDAQKADVSYEVLAGPAARAVVEKAEEWQADMIIIGSHGRGLWKRVLLGSVSDRVLHHAPCSVLVVRKRV